MVIKTAMYSSDNVSWLVQSPLYAGESLVETAKSREPSLTPFQSAELLRNILQRSGNRAL